jgi:hypothetical protein
MKIGFFRGRKRQNISLFDYRAAKHVGWVSLEEHDFVLFVVSMHLQRGIFKITNEHFVLLDQRQTTLRHAISKHVVFMLGHNNGRPPEQAMDIFRIYKNCLSFYMHRHGSKQNKHQVRLQRHRDSVHIYIYTYIYVG